MGGTRLLAFAALISIFKVSLCALSSSAAESMLIVGSQSHDYAQKVHPFLDSSPQQFGRHLMQQTSGEPEPIMRWLVSKHNELRARHGVQPLIWDWNLAWNAYYYVLNCPNGHSGQPGIGENLAWGHQDFNHAMRDWYDEIQFYTFNRPGFAENTGHFTALVWSDTNRIGCAANLRCRFKTWICQFTPAGNLVSYGGSVDVNLWMSQVRAPGQQYVMGTRPDGSPSYSPYDPTGESTRGLPAPMYGELKNFGYVPKPGQSVIMYDWPKFIPTSILQEYIRHDILAKFLDADTLALITPEIDGNKKLERAVVGWQLSIPAKVIKQYVPADVLEQYVPSGVVMATDASTKAPLSSTEQRAEAEPSDATITAPVAIAPAIAPGGRIASSNSGRAGAAPPTAPQNNTAAAVLKPQGGLLSDLMNSYRPTQPALTYYPVQQTQPTYSYSMQQAQPMYAAVQHPDGSTAYVPMQTYTAATGYVPVQQTSAGQYVAAGQLQYIPAQPQQLYAQVPSTAAAPGGSTAGSLGSSTYIISDGQSSQSATTAPLQAVASAPGGYNGYNSMPSLLPNSMQAALDRHNAYRRKHGVPPVTWDPSMAARAAEYAGTCPMGLSGRAGVGENLAWGYPDAVSAVDSWYGQMANYNFGTPGFTATAAMFTQLVWADTEKIGCAVDAGCAMPTIACQYYPAGNVLGVDWSSRVPAPAAAVPKPLNPGTQDSQTAAAVEKPEKKPEPLPRPYYARVGEPLANGGAFVSVPYLPASYHVAAAVLSPELQAALDRHNELRVKHGSPALQWDDSIASTAQSWAAGCPSGHSGQPGVGENMAWGYSSLSAAVDAWYEEVSLYDFTSPGWSTATGHFTQVVWASTTRLGCAVNTACSWPTYVCQYGPPGNVIGLDWRKEVKPLSAATVTNPADTAVITAAPMKPAPIKPTPKPSPKLSPRLSPKPTPSPLPMPTAAVQLTAEQSAALARTNMYRQKHQAPALAWDAALAASAAQWAAGCPTGHSGSRGVGENMAWGYSNFNAAVDAWYAEVKRFDFKRPQWGTATGHFTALVWTDTTKMGCASNPSCPWRTYICQYQQPGNVIGVDWSSKVKPAVAAAAVAKPGRALDVPAGANSARVGQPVLNDGNPISLGSVPGDRPTAAAVLSPDLQAALDRHNELRSKHGAPLLEWDDSIATTAKSWAAGCPSGHSGRSGVGENMAWGYSSLSAAVDAWYDEVSLYDFTSPGWSTATGHFTQVVWASTTRLGCAINTRCSWPTYVCQYGPPGNVIGLDWRKEVKRVIAQSPPALPPNITPAPGPAKPATNKPSPVPNPNPVQPLQQSQSPAPKAAVAARPAPTSTGPALTAEQSAALTRTNMYRQKHQAPALAWDAALAASAARWAAGCPTGHSGSRGVGENMAWGYNNLNAAVDAWYAEVKQYDFSKPGWNVATGHFTALVWTDTTKMGCASNTTCSRPTYVCQYQQPGNVLGIDWSSKVKPAVVIASGAGPKPSHRPLLVVPPPSPKVASVAAEMQNALNLLNNYRQLHQVPALVWSDKLAASAKAWSNGCQFAVSGTPGVGEAVGFGYATLTAAVTNWYKQVSKYGFSNPGWSSKTSLFTQLVWKDTTAVGCAVNKACTWAMYVCQFSPSGNQMGPLVDWKQMVLPAVVQQPTAAAVTKPGWARQNPNNGDYVGGHGAGFQRPTADPDTTPGSDAQLLQALQQTNLWRTKHQASPLSWDNDLATMAAANVAECPLGYPGVRGVGHALAWGLRSFADAVNVWGGQYNFYNFSSPGFSLRSGDFTQLVWRSTSKLGCAYNTRCQLPTYLCLFAPQGNDVDAKWSQQVMPAVVLNSVTASGGSKAPELLPSGPKPQPIGDTDGASTDYSEQHDTYDSSMAAEQPAPDMGSSSYSDDSGSATSQLVQQQQQPDVYTPMDRTNVAQDTSSLVITPTWRQQQPQQPMPAEQPVSPDQYTPGYQQGFIPDLGHSQLPGLPLQQPTGVNPTLPKPSGKLSDKVTQWVTLQPAPGYTPPTKPLNNRPSVPLTQPSGSQITPAPLTNPRPAQNTPPQVVTTPATPTAPQPAGSSTAATTTPAAGGGASAPPQFAAVLDAHNSYRARHQAPALQWDASIAARAQQYADGCPQGHSGDRGVGENLAWGYPSWQAAIDAWYNEVAQYNFARPGWSGATGHFTQLVWKDTTTVGCGINARCGMVTYVCQYAPAGNVIGVDWSRQVMPAARA